MIQFQGNDVRQWGAGWEKIWTLAGLLEASDPLPGEPLAQRNEILQRAATLAAEAPGELQEAARLHLDFWLNFRSQHISERRFEYKTSVSASYDWQPTINEAGYSTWRDGLALLGFISFEQFLNTPPQVYPSITPEMRMAIERLIGRRSAFKTGADAGPIPADAPSRPLSPREKMDLAEYLLQTPDSAEGAELLISLLEYEAEESYWRNYVFNRFFKLRDNPTVQQFIVQCLRGDDETHFKKAVDVLVMWGVYGDKNLMDRPLLLALNWNDATANDPDFRTALDKSIKIVLKT